MHPVQWLDRTCRTAERTWLALRSVGHETAPEPGLRRALDTDDLEALQTQLDAVTDAFPDHVDAPRIYEVNVTRDGEPAAGRYEGRDCGRPQIRLDPAATHLAAVWTHELMHDVSRGVTPGDSALVTDTYRETVAYLGERYVRDRQDLPQRPVRTPFCIGHADEWRRLYHASTPTHHADVRGALQDAATAATAADWEAVDAAADYIVDRPPHSPGDPADSMVLDCLYTTPLRRRADAADALHRLAADPVPKTRQETADAVARYTAALDDYTPPDAASAVDRLVDAAPAPLPGNPDCPYDDMLDLRHTVGHSLAAALDATGTTPHALLDAPDRYAATTRDALTYTIQHAQDHGPSRTGYDLGAIL